MPNQAASRWESLLYPAIYLAAPEVYGQAGYAICAYCETRKGIIKHKGARMPVSHNGPECLDIQWPTALPATEMVSCACVLMRGGTMTSITATHAVVFRVACGLSAGSGW